MARKKSKTPWGLIAVVGMLLLSKKKDQPPRDEPLPTGDQPVPDQQPIGRGYMGQSPHEFGAFAMLDRPY